MLLFLLLLLIGELRSMRDKKKVYLIERVFVYFLTSYGAVKVLTQIYIQLCIFSRHILLFSYLNRQRQLK